MALHQLRGQRVGLARGGAVANRNQLGFVLLRERGDGGDRGFAVAARLEGIHGGGIHQLAGGVHHRHLDPGADARVEADGGARAGGGGEQQVLEVAREHADRLFLGALAQLAHQLELEMDRDLHAPRPARGFTQPTVARPALVTDAEAHRDAAFAGVRCVGIGALHIQRQAQHALVASAQQRQRAVRGHGGDRLGEVEPVAELGALGLLALDHRRAHLAVIVQVRAQLAEQGGVFGKVLHQDLARAVEHRLGVGKTGLGIQILFGLDLGGQVRVGEQRLGERADAGLARNLRLGAALGLVGQVEVFEALLGVGVLDLGAQLGAELALLLD